MKLINLSRPDSIECSDVKMNTQLFNLLRRPTRNRGGTGTTLSGAKGDFQGNLRAKERCFISRYGKSRWHPHSVNREDLMRVHQNLLKR